MDETPHALDQLRWVFDNGAAGWEAYTQTPLGRLRQDLVLHHLLEHLNRLPGPLQILDAGGGTGSYALPLAVQGHAVCLLDLSPRMLERARAKAEAFGAAVARRLSCLCAPVEELAECGSGPRFDVVLAHTLLEYLADPIQALRRLAAALVPGGLLSLVVVNPQAEMLRRALGKYDLVGARAALCGVDSPADLFGLPRRILPRSAIAESLRLVGVRPMAQYGIRVLADYLPADALAGAAAFDALFALERDAGALEPYIGIARYIQFIAAKDRPPG